MEKFRFYLNVFNNAPFDADVFLKRSETTTNVTTLAVGKWFDIPNALNTDIYTFKSKNGTLLVVSTFHTDQYAREFSGKAFGAKIWTLFRISISKGIQFLLILFS